VKKSLEDPDRGALLQDLARLKSDDDDAVQQHPKWFLPLEAHGRALRPETLVVRGGRGAGKSALFHFLGHLETYPSLANAMPTLPAQTRWLEGFSGAASHPSAAVVGQFALTATDDERRFFWFGWLCARVALLLELQLPGAALDRAVRDKDPTAIAEFTRVHLVQLTAWLDERERTAPDSITVSYDSLDRIGTSSDERRALTASLLAMWLSLGDRYRRIRPKIFVREDLFQAACTAFPDASKLDARSVSLDWRVEDLYRVLIKHMANVSEDLKGWIEESNRGIPLTWAGDLGWTPPPKLAEDGRPSQKGFVDHLAGEWMGDGPKKGMTYRWIPNRLQDAHASAVPRSILSLIRNTAEVALARSPKAKNLRLLHPEELVLALEKTSKRRSEEVLEEFPVVSRLENLRGKAVMIDRSLVVKALARRVREDDNAGDDGDAVLRELCDLGVMSERPNKRVDIPDIYRYHFGIKRKGGVKRPR